MKQSKSLNLRKPTASRPNRFPQGEGGEKSLQSQAVGGYKKTKYGKRRKFRSKKNRPFVVILLFLWVGVSSLLGELTQKRQMLFYFDKIEVNGAVDVFVTPGQEMKRH